MMGALNEIRKRLSTPRRELEREGLAKLKMLINYLWENSKYYRDLWKGSLGRKPEIKSLNDISNLPLVGHELLQYHAKEAMAVKESDVALTFFSGGTAGLPKMVMWTKKDWYRRSFNRATLNYIRGIKPGDIALIVLPFGTWGAGFSSQESLRLLNVTVIPFGFWWTGIKFLIKLMQSLSITILVATPSLALLIARYMEENGEPPPETLRLIATTGEDVPSTTRNELKKFYNADVRAIYAATESLVGVECPKERGYHFLPDDYIIEVVDPKTGEPVEKEEVGEIVITRLFGLAAPLVRYRLGDLVKVIEGSCDCGIDLPMIKFVGRTENTFVLTTGVNVFDYQIKEALSQSNIGINRYRIILLDDEKGFETVQFIGECENTSQMMIQKVYNALSRLSIDFEDIISQGLVKLEVKLVPPGTLLVKSNSGKTLTIIDKRRYKK